MASSGQQALVGEVSADGSLGSRRESFGIEQVNPCNRDTDERRASSEPGGQLVGQPVETDDSNVVHVVMTTRGFAWLPADLVFERVRSRAINGVGILMMFWLFASYKVLRNDSVGKCREARMVPDCDDEDSDTSELLNPSNVSFSLAVIAAVVVGLSNSLYFARGTCHGTICTLVARVISLLFGLTLFVEAIVDLSYCRGPPAFKDFCAGPQAGPLAKFIAGDYSHDVDGAPVKQKAMMVLGDVDLCSDLVNTTNVEDCKKAMPDTANATRCGDPEVLTCTCERVDNCFKGYMTQPTTVTRSILWFMLVAALNSALLWDVALRVRYIQGRGFFVIGDLSVYDVPYYSNRLGRRVPLAMMLSWMMNLTWTLDMYASEILPAIHLLEFDEPDIKGLGPDFERYAGKAKEISYMSATFFIILQFVIFTCATIVNLRTYWRHSNELASLDWHEFLKPDSLALEPEGWDGVSLDRFRHANNGFAPVYFGAAWASLHVGTIIFTVFLTLIFTVIATICKIPEARALFWEHVVSPASVPLFAFVLTMVSQKAAHSCVWGQQRDRFPRRVGLLVFCDLANTMITLVASIFTALIRLVKSLIASMVGLLSVTDPGAHQVGVLKDGMHNYYLEVLWQERFKLEVDRGTIEVTEPEVGRRVECHDTSVYCAKVCGAFWVTFVLLMLIGLWMNGGWGFFEAWMGVLEEKLLGMAQKKLAKQGADVPTPGTEQ